MKSKKGGKRTQNEGSIYQRADNRWVAVVSLGWQNGRRRRKNIYGPTAEAVRVALTALRARLDKGERIEDESKVNLKTFAARWLANIAPDLKPRTVSSYKQLLDLHVLPTLGARKLRDLNRSDVRRLLNEKRTAGGLGKNSCRLIRAVISALYADAIEEGLVAANPAAAIARRRAGKRADSITLNERAKAIRPFGESELSAFLKTAEADAEAYPLFLLLARAGLRPGEAFALKWSDLDFTRREILVERALSRGKIGTTKTGSVRRADMSQELAGILKALLVHRERQTLQNGWRENPDWVFVNRAGKPLDESRVRKQFARAMKAAQLSGHRVYDLRHSYATLLLEHGAPITYVAAQLGHAKPTTTLQWYAHWLPRDDKAFVDSLDQPSTLPVIATA